MKLFSFDICTKKTVSLTLMTLLTACGCGGGNDSSTSIDTNPFANESALGKSLFFDVNLSQNRTQSCSTCHDANHAFIDARLDTVTGKITALSTGDDGISKGLRNAPTATYRRFSPIFKLNTTRKRLNSQQPDYQGPIGGQFFDGRAVDLEAQAGGPPLAAKEMGMPTKASVVERIRENADYVIAFEDFYGEGILNDSEQVFQRMTESIAAFERSDEFSSFDSKYDRSLQDPTILSLKEAFGKSLFFSQQFTNCATCHQLRPNSNAEETFSAYEYHNIGTPINGVTDEGLFRNTGNNADKGKFKTPTLRNIAVTEPYMHNGVFQDLRTVVEFYDKFLSNSIHTINPETGQPWREAEFPDTVNLTELRDGRRMNTDSVEAMVCFMRTLTDARYEGLIEEKGISCEDE